MHFLRWRSETRAPKFIQQKIGPDMPRKFDQTTLDHLIIRRALHNAAGQFEVCFSEFTAIWHDSKTKKNVKFVGTIDSQIVLKTAQIQGGNQVYDLKSIFSAAELRAFNYLINSENAGRARFAA